MPLPARPARPPAATAGTAAARRRRRWPKTCSHRCARVRRRRTPYRTGYVAPTRDLPIRGAETHALRPEPAAPDNRLIGCNLASALARGALALLHGHGNKSQVALAVLEAQQHRPASSLLDPVDALGDVVERCDRLLCDLDDHVADPHALLGGRARGVDLQHDHALQVLADVVLGAQLLAQRGEHEADERGARRRPRLAAILAA